MRAIIILLIFSALSSHAADRLERDRESKAAFQQLQFFAEGHGMHLSPDLISLFNFVTDDGAVSQGPIREMLTKRWGMVLNDEQRVAGLFDMRTGPYRIGVVGCVACHSGRAAGQYIVGLGNKTIDVVQLAGDVHRLEQVWQSLKPFKSRRYSALEQSALNFSSYLANPQIGNLTQGLVPVSFIRGWFYRVQNEAVPADMSRGQVKVPSLWGYEFKRPVGQFCDGYGNGVNPGWAIAVELAAGQKVEAVRRYLPRVSQAELLFNDFLPPPYPFAVDQARAMRGQKLFEHTCAGCHGTYARDADGLPVFAPPRFIPWSVVRTDRDRLNGKTAAFNAMVESNPLRDVIQHNSLGDGYFAPRLNGIWARFPYLHNGSVPSIRALLTPPRQRPRAFSLRDAGERERFDEQNLGLTPVSNLDLNSRQTYNVNRVGHTNLGHDFYTDLSDDDKSGLIEYLKTL